MNAYVTKVYEGLKARNSHESEFLQAAWEILNISQIEAGIKEPGGNGRSETEGSSMLNPG